MKNILLVVVMLVLPVNLIYGKTQSESSYDMDVKESELICLANAVFFEARDQKQDTAKIAVAFVVLNRVESKLYPNTICGVTQQKKHPVYHQFSYHNSVKLSQIAKKGEAWRIDKAAFEKAKKIAKQALAIKKYAPDYDITKGSMYYYNPKLANPKWAKSVKLKKIATFGDHVYFRRVK